MPAEMRHYMHMVVRPSEVMDEVPPRRGPTAPGRGGYRTLAGRLSDSGCANKTPQQMLRGFPVGRVSKSLLLLARHEENIPSPSARMILRRVFYLSSVPKLVTVLINPP